MFLLMDETYYKKYINNRTNEAYGIRYYPNYFSNRLDGYSMHIANEPRTHFTVYDNTREANIKLTAFIKRIRSEIRWWRWLFLGERIVRVPSSPEKVFP